MLRLELTWPGLVIGAAALIWLVMRPGSRRLGLSLAVMCLALLGFAVWLPEAVFAPAFLMPVSMMAGLALALALTAALEAAPQAAARPLSVGAAALLASFCALIFRPNLAFLQELTLNPRGRQVIEAFAGLHLDEVAPPPLVMLPWGGDYFALSYGLRVTGELEGFQAVDHRADLGAALRSGETILTLPETFYAFPPGMWAGWAGESIALGSYAPGFVEVTRDPLIAALEGQPLPNGIALVAYQLADLPTGYHLRLLWQAHQPPEVDYSVFIHLTRVPQPASAPVHGWHPVSAWQVGEVVQEDYLLPVVPEACCIRAGLYRALPDGGFEEFEALLVRLP